MRRQCVYDTMVLLQIAGRGGRRHFTWQAVERGHVLLHISDALLAELTAVLHRPTVRQKVTGLTDATANAFLNDLLHFSRHHADVPPVFTLPQHPDDDHLLNLAIAAEADFLVTWERRLLQLGAADSPDGQTLRVAAPKLAIVTPPVFGERIRSVKPT